MTNILIIQGHPDPPKGRLYQAIANAYGETAEAAGHTVGMIRMSDHTVPLMRSTSQ